MGDAAEGCVERDAQLQWKWFQDLGLGLIPGSKEAHEQVSHRGKDSPMPYFREVVYAFLATPEPLLLPQQEAEAGLSAGVI